MVDSRSPLNMERCQEERFGENLLKELRRRISDQLVELSPEEFQNKMMQLATLAGISATFYTASEWYSKGKWAAAQKEWGRIYATFTELVPNDSKPERATCLSHMCLAALKLNQFDKAQDYGKRAVQLARETPCRQIEAKALGNLANVHRLTQNFDAGINCRKTAIRLFRELRDVRGEAMELTGLGNLEYERGNLEEAIQLHQQGLRLVRDTQNYNLMPLIMQNLEHTQATLVEQLKQQPRPAPYPQEFSREVQLGEELLARAENSYRNQDWRAIQRYASEALSIFQSVNVPAGILAASHFLAGAYAEQELWQQALEPAQLAVDLCREHKFIGGLETGLKNLFTVLQELDDVPACIACLEEHLDLTMTYGMRHEAGPVLKTLGEYMRRIDDYKGAKRFQHQALVIFKNLEDQQNISIVLDEFSTIASYEDHYDDALDYSRQALEIFEKLGKSHDVAVGMANRAEILLRIGDTASAAENLADAVLYFRKFSPDRNLIAALEGLGLICTEEMMFAEAISFYQEAYDTAQQLNMTDLMLKIELNLIDLQIRIGGLPLERLQNILKRPELTPSTQCEVMCDLARIQLQIGNSDETLKLLNEAIANAEKRGLQKRPGLI